MKFSDSAEQDVLRSAIARRLSARIGRSVEIEGQSWVIESPYILCYTNGTRIALHWPSALKTLQDLRNLDNALDLIPETVEEELIEWRDFTKNPGDLSPSQRHSLDAFFSYRNRLAATKKQRADDLAEAERRVSEWNARSPALQEIVDSKRLATSANTPTLTPSGTWFSIEEVMKSDSSVVRVAGCDGRLTSRRALRDYLPESSEPGPSPSTEREP